MHYPGHKLAFILASAVLVAWLAAMTISLRAARLDPQATGTMLVIFEPGIDNNEALARLVDAGALPMRKTWASFIWVAHGDEPGLSGKLVKAGALATYRNLPISPALSGCFAYADAKMQQLFSFN